MRFMLFMIPNNESEEGVMPTPEQVAGMMAFNKELSDAGVLLALDGLQPSSKGARISFAGGRAKVTDGPFTEAKEIIGGYWIIDVKSKEEAVAWASRCPADERNVIEVRQIFEMSDFGPEVERESGALAEEIGRRLPAARG